MTEEGMTNAFGREALFMLVAMFQHTSKICEEGQFLHLKSLIQLVKENGKNATFCKSQVHPSIVYSALKQCCSRRLQPLAHRITSCKCAVAALKALLLLLL